ncbi:Protein RecA [Rhynchospora pubera]|uniref:Protein RecA n=1 Tax=Rhynchospora pubera TaxID=906938 RepID=A0AAV8C057_9POAL|nr:Protein RecA [Rhynchospora pubera]
MARFLRHGPLNRALFSIEGYRQGINGSSFFTRNFAAKGGKKAKSNTIESGHETLSRKDSALHQAIDQIQASFGKGAIMWLGRSQGPREVPVVSTGSFNLDTALGIGGLPKGRVVEVYGPEASGKTTLALHVIAEAQKNGGYCAFIDAEHALDPSLAEVIGVKIDNLLLAQPDSGEQALSLVDTLIRSGSVDVVVVDSVAALVPKAELDGEMGDAHMALQARLMSQALRKLSHSLSMSQTILLFINQVRSKLGTFVGFGGPTEVTSGGNALKFYASVRLNIRRIGFVKKGEEPIGNQVQVKVVKNKHAPPFKTALFELEYGKGICRESEVIELGVKYKFIRKAAAMYYMDERSFRGKDTIKRFFAENKDVMEDLIVKLKEKLSQATPKMKSDREGEEDDDDDLEEAVVTSIDSSDEEIAAAAEA